MKIGLIAMNGIQCADKELAAMGLSLPGFLDRGKAIASMPSLALLTLAGLTPPHHQVTYLEVPDIRTVNGLPGEFDFVGISSYSAQIAEAYELADRYRAAGVPVIIGGPHATVLPMEAARHADAVAIGEGEPIWPTVVSDAERGQLQQFYGAQFSKFSLADSPMPAYELLEPSRYNRLLVQTSRGCPHRCNFCAASILISNRYKQKPASRVLSEIDAICSIWKRPFIEFADDNSFINHEYWHELLPQLKTRGVRWFAETDVSIGDDDRLLRLMSDAGCKEVLIGLESPTITNIDGIELHANWKHKAWTKYKPAVRNIQSHGIRVIGCFVLGLDGQTPSVVNDLVDFTGELDLFDVQVTIQTPFPGTPLYSTLLEQGRLIEPENWSKCTLFDINYQPSDMSVLQLRDALIAVAEQLYNRHATDTRRKHFRDNLRALRVAS
ncbi:MAG TPA: radical SAM protein [Candidatus Obscuribacterales bacterium]